MSQQSLPLQPISEDVLLEKHAGPGERGMGDEQRHRARVLLAL